MEYLIGCIVCHLCYLKVWCKSSLSHFNLEIMSFPTTFNITLGWILKFHSIQEQVGVKVLQIVISNRLNLVVSVLGEAFIVIHLLSVVAGSSLIQIPYLLAIHKTFHLLEFLWYISWITCFPSFFHIFLFLTSHFTGIPERWKDIAPKNRLGKALRLKQKGRTDGLLELFTCRDFVCWESDKKPQVNILLQISWKTYWVVSSICTRGLDPEGQLAKDISMAAGSSVC